MLHAEVIFFLIYITIIVFAVIRVSWRAKSRVDEDFWVSSWDAATVTGTIMGLGCANVGLWYQGI